MQQRHQAVKAWLSLVGNVIGMGGFIFELGFDRLEHPGILPFCILFAGVAQAQDSLPRLLFSSVRRLRVSFPGFELELGSNPSDTKTPTNLLNQSRVPTIGVREADGTSTETPKLSSGRPASERPSDNSPESTTPK